MTKNIQWLTICITSYNRPEYLNKLLETIRDLPFFIKVIVADDCSPRLPEITEVIDYWSPKFEDNLTFYSNVFNLGEVENKNKLFSIVDSDYLLLIGDDDLIKNDVFIDEIKWIFDQKDLLDIYFYGYEIIDNYGVKVKRRKSFQNIFSNKYNDNLNKSFMNFLTFPFYYCHPAFYIIKTDVAKQLSLDSSIGIGEDYDFLIRIMNNIDTVNSWVIRNKILFQWRKHQGSNTNQSANLYNRFLTKFNIFLKYGESNIVNIRFFPFLVLPMYFDNFSVNLYTQQLELIRKHDQDMEMKFKRYYFLCRWPFKFVYLILKILEYIKVQLIILF